MTSTDMTDAPQAAAAGSNVVPFSGVPTRALPYSTAKLLKEVSTAFQEIDEEMALLEKDRADAQNALARMDERQKRIRRLQFIGAEYVRRTHESLGIPQPAPNTGQLT